MGNIVFESDRLYFKEFEPIDHKLIFDLNKDPDVTKFTGDPISSIEQAEEVLLNVIIPQYKTYGFGRWAVYVRSTDNFIGWSGLKFLKESNEIDLGYRFMKPFWGKGYAGEAALATVRFGFEVKDLDEIIGRAVPQNIYSIKILQACGMEYFADTSCHGHDAATYRITKEMFKKIKNKINA